MTRFYWFADYSRARALRRFEERMQAPHGPTFFLDVGIHTCSVHAYLAAGRHGGDPLRFPACRFLRRSRVTGRTP